MEPSGTLLGNLSTFRQVFCDGDDRQLVRGQEHELRRRVGTVCHRTLRRQAQEFLEKPFVDRRAQLFQYSMSAEERALYDGVTTYLMRPDLLAFRGNHRRLLIISFHRQMASSVRALAASLGAVARRLRSMLDRFDPAMLDREGGSLLDDLEEDASETDRDEGPAPDPARVREELAEVEGFIERAEALPRDSKAGALLQAVHVVLERADRGEGSGKLVIFTESLATQAYLRELLLGDSEDGGLAASSPDSGENSAALRDSDITLFRGNNDSPRAQEALARWHAEVGESIPRYAQPSRDVALRLALVHEFKTRSRVFISTEAGAKGLNLQFCDTIINYDLPWNPQRIEQRIGRCHRYGQSRDVTVINFLASDNETHRLTFEILSQKLELFGTVLDASDSVLYEAREKNPEILASAVSVDFERSMHRILDQARTQEDVEAGVRELGQTMDQDGEKLEAALARTRGLIESRLDENVRQVFRDIRAQLPQHLAELDQDLDRLVTGYLSAIGVAFQRVKEGGHLRYEIAASDRLPNELAEGLVVGIGHASDLGDADPVHLGHPLVKAAVEESRRATEGISRVRLHIDGSSPQQLRNIDLNGKRGRLLVLKVSSKGFEPVERLLAFALVEGEDEPLPQDVAAALLQLEVSDFEGPFRPPIAIDPEELEDSIEEVLFLEQGDVAGQERLRFDGAIEQIERFMDDKALVLGRQRTSMVKRLAAAEAARDSVVGAIARSQAEDRVTSLTESIEKLEDEIQRLESREDPDYERWRQRAHERRYANPSHERILDLEFVVVGSERGADG